MLLEIFSLDSIKTSFRLAKALYTEIKDTETKLAEATDAFANLDLNKSAVRKLIGLINASQTSLQNTFFRNTNGNLTINQTQIDASLDSQIRTILSPLVGKDVSTSSIENLKKKQILEIYNNQLKPLGVKKPNFDKMLKVSHEIQVPLNYCFVTPQGFIATLEEKEEWSAGGGGDSGGGSGGDSGGGSNSFYIDSNGQVSLLTKDIFIHGRRFDSPEHTENGLPVFYVYDYDDFSSIIPTLPIEEFKKWSFVFEPDIMICKVHEQYAQIIYPAVTGQPVDGAAIEQSVRELFESVPEVTSSRYKFRAISTVTPLDSGWGEDDWVLKANEKNYSLTEEERATGNLVFTSTTGPGSPVQYNVFSTGTFRTSDGPIIPSKHSVLIQLVDTQTDIAYTWNTLEYIVRVPPTVPGGMEL